MEGPVPDHVGDLALSHRDRHTHSEQKHGGWAQTHAHHLLQINSKHVKKVQALTLWLAHLTLTIIITLSTLYHQALYHLCNLNPKKIT